MTKAIKKWEYIYPIGLYALVFLGGFCNLAIEIITPRLFSSIFGNTTMIWAIIISVTLVGMAVGYYLGGRFTAGKVHQILPWLLVLNAFWLVMISWLIWSIPRQVVDLVYIPIFLAAFGALFVPSLVFGMISPMVIVLLSVNSTAEKAGRTAGNVFGIGTIGSVLGALTAAFYFIPYVGLSASLRLFAVGLVFFSIMFLYRYLKMAGIVAVLACAMIPQPAYQWQNDLSLLAQEEGTYQTIRIYTDGVHFVRLHLGPTYETEMNLKTGEPDFGYALTMVELSGDVRGKEILMIGGAGHTIARTLEKHGASVTEVEIDPLVANLSDRYFGPIKGKVIIDDGRAFIERADDGQYDLVLVDAFNGPASIPPQLTTVEFFKEIVRTLKPGGKMIYNFIGAPEGTKSASYRALTTTISAAFADARVSSVSGQDIDNIIFVASNALIEGLSYSKAPMNGALLTDDLNPIDIFLEEARQ